MNDTHPTVAVAELMRLLMDENGFTFQFPDIKLALADLSK